MSVACTIGMAELQHDGKCKNDYKSGAIVFTGGTLRVRELAYRDDYGTLRLRSRFPVT
jgi:hypothetical protein